MAYLECGHCGQEWTETEVKALEHTVHTCHAGQVAKGYEEHIAALEARCREIEAESEARHQSCLVLMKSVADHREHIAKLEAALNLIASDPHGKVSEGYKQIARSALETACEPICKACGKPRPDYLTTKGPHGCSEANRRAVK